MTEIPISAPQAAPGGNGHIPEAAQRVHRRTVAATAPATPAEPTYIGLITRAIAFAIDAAVINGIAVIVAGATALILSILPVGHDFRTVVAAIGAVAWVVWAIGYFASFWSATGQTPGNRAMRIRVTQADGSTLGFLRAVVRVGALVLAALPLMLGFAPILFNERRRGLQDAIAGTVVVDAGAPQPRAVAIP